MEGKAAFPPGPISVALGTVMDAVHPSAPIGAPPRSCGFQESKSGAKKEATRRSREGEKGLRGAGFLELACVSCLRLQRQMTTGHKAHSHSLGGRGQKSRCRGDTLPPRSPGRVPVLPPAPGGCLPSLHVAQFVAALLPSPPLWHMPAPPCLPPLCLLLFIRTPANWIRARPILA